MAPQLPVLLLHGMGCGPWVWDEVRVRMPDVDLMAVTLAGHRGGRPLELAGPISPAEQMVGDLERQLDAAGVERAHVVGNSLGGWLALRLAERGRAASVLSLAPAGGWMPGTYQERKLLLRFALGRQAARRILPVPRVLASPAVRRGVMRPVVARESAMTCASTYALVRDLAQCQALQVGLRDKQARRMSSIGDLDVPTTIVWSALDRVLDGDWARVRYRHLDPTTTTLPGVGHLPMLDDPDAVARLIGTHVSEPDEPVSA